MDNGEYIHRATYFKNNPSEKRMRGWHVHHCDCDKFNNDISNLVHIPEIVHSWIHKAYGHKKNGKMPSKKIIEAAFGPYRKNWSDCKIGEVKQRIDRVRNNHRVAGKLGLLLSPSKSPGGVKIVKKKKNSKNKKESSKKACGKKKQKTTPSKEDQAKKAAEILAKRSKMSPNEKRAIKIK